MGGGCDSRLSCVFVVVSVTGRVINSNGFFEGTHLTCHERRLAPMSSGLGEVGEGSCGAVQVEIPDRKGQ